MSRDHNMICVHCRAESKGLALRSYAVGPSSDGHCALCGSLYCQKCLRPFLPQDELSADAGFKIVGESIYCAYRNCGAGHPFMIDRSGRVVLQSEST